MLRVTLSIWFVLIGLLPVQRFAICRDCADRQAATNEQAPSHCGHLADCLSSEHSVPCDCECHRYSNRKESATKSVGWSPLRLRSDTRSIGVVRSDQETFDCQFGLQPLAARGHPMTRSNVLLCIWLV